MEMSLGALNPLARDDRAQQLEPSVLGHTDYLVIYEEAPLGIRQQLAGRGGVCQCTLARNYKSSKFVNKLRSQNQHNY